MLTWDGYEDAVIGIAYRGDESFVVYDWYKCLDILVERDGMTRDEAKEWFLYNTAGASMGGGDPAWLDSDNDAISEAKGE